MDIISQALKVMESQFIEPQDKINSSELAKNYCRLQLGLEKDEVFGVLFLNSQNQLIAFERMFQGSIAESQVYLRPIVRKVLEHNAARMILTHNHPSGSTKPSDADIRLTRDFMAFFRQIDCPVVDHIIVTAKESVSLTEMGVL